LTVSIASLQTPAMLTLWRPVAHTLAAFIGACQKTRKRCARLGPF